VSLGVLALCVAMRGFMARWCAWVTAVFSVLFMAQYLVHLGFPGEVFGTEWSLVPADASASRASWFLFLGIDRVQRSSLLANCLSAFYLQYRMLAIDTAERIAALPRLVRAVVEQAVEHVYAMGVRLIVIVAALIRSLDGLLFYFLAALLLACALTFHSDQRTSLLAMTWYTLVVVAMRMFSRLPGLPSTFSGTLKTYPSTARAYQTRSGSL
jgi:hypothetical protein